MNAKQIRSWIEMAASQWDSMGNASVNEKWSRLTNNANVSEYGTDEFGFSPEFVKRVLPIATLVHRGYFRANVTGVENVPEGRVLLIANHSGQLPFDGVMIATSLILDADPPRMVRSMIEKWVPSLPFISTILARLGQITGIPENCRRLLEAEETILVFPEGARGISKTFDKRYQLFPLGILPLPVKYHIHFGKPILFEGSANDEDAVIMEKVRVVEELVQDRIDTMVKERTSIFW